MDNKCFWLHICTKHLPHRYLCTNPAKMVEGIYALCYYDEDTCDGFAKIRDVAHLGLKNPEDESV